MMRKSILVLLCAMVLATLAASQEKAAPTPESQLAPVAWFVGGTWVADVADPQSGAKTHIENLITWAPNHAAIEFVTRFNGAPHYYGFYAYDAAAKAVKFFYTSEDGQLTIGTATPEADGKTLQQEFDITQPGGKVGHVKSTLLREGNDIYHFTVFLQQNGDWKPVLNVTYHREK